MAEEPKYKSEPDHSSRGGEVEAPRPAHSRRAFLKGIGAAGMAVPLAAVAARAASRIPDILSDPNSSVVDLKARPKQAYKKRLNAAKDDLKVKVPPHPNN